MSGKYAASLRRSRKRYQLIAVRLPLVREIDKAAAGTRASRPSLRDRVREKRIGPHGMKKKRNGVVTVKTKVDAESDCDALADGDSRMICGGPPARPSTSTPAHDGRLHALVQPLWHHAADA